MERFPSDNNNNQKSPYPYPSIKSWKKTNKTPKGYNEDNTIQKENQEWIDEPAPVAGPLLENNPQLQNKVTEYSKPNYEEEMYPTEQFYPEEKESKITPSNCSNKQSKKVMNLLNMMNKRLRKYENAMVYFQDNKLYNKKKDAEDKCNQLIKLINKVKKGKKIDQNEIPIAIKPEYINGCSIEERYKKYQTFIDELVNQRKQTFTELQELICLYEKQQCKDNNKKKEINKLKNDCCYYDKLIELSKINVSKKWIPVPLYSKVRKEIQFEKENIIPELTMMIYLGTIDYERKEMYLSLVIKDLKKGKQESVYPKSPGIFEKEIKWTFEQSDFNTLYSKTLEVQVYHKR